MIRPAVGCAAISFVLVLLGCCISRVTCDVEETWGWRVLERPGRSTDSSIDAIRVVLRRISDGNSDTKDDDEVVKLVENEIVQTARKVKAPSLSIEAAASRAQVLVSDLTSAYTGAIYGSNSTADARRNFMRFQNTVQRIVDFTKSGRFVVSDRDEEV